MERYLIVLEKTETGYSAYSPDVPGCIATGETAENTVDTVKEALHEHLALFLEDHDPIPRGKGAESYLEAVEMSQGNDFLIAHIEIEPKTIQFN